MAGNLGVYYYISIYIYNLIINISKKINKNKSTPQAGLRAEVVGRVDDIVVLRRSW
jgi:hypothetical protein